LNVNHAENFVEANVQMVGHILNLQKDAPRVSGVKVMKSDSITPQPTLINAWHQQMQVMPYKFRKYRLKI